MRWWLILHNINHPIYKLENTMKLKKSLVTCAVFMALGLTQTAFAKEDSKQAQNLIQTDIIASATGNVIVLKQTSQEGATFGNNVLLAQEGDTNGIDAAVDGEANETEIVQIGVDNIAISNSVGDSNTQVILQAGESNGASIEVTGDNNMLNISQEGAGYFGIGNEAVNVINGSDNEVIMEQSDGGHWSYNKNMEGSANIVETSQAGVWGEIHIDAVLGDNNEIEMSQDGYWNAARITNLQGNDNELSLLQDGDRNQTTIAELVGDENEIEIDQDGNYNIVESTIFLGNHNNVSVDQVEDSNSSSFDIIGDENEMSIAQAGMENISYVGAIGSGNDFNVMQVGDLNESHIVNFNGYENDIDVIQAGDENVAVIQASAVDNTLTTDGNDIMLSQDGSENDAVVNMSTIINSNENTIDIAQNGDLNSLDILVEGSGHSIDIAQNGDENMIIGANGEAMLIGGVEIDLTINQSGTGNLVEGSLISAMGSVSITQVGDWNSATIIQQ